MVTGRRLQLTEPMAVTGASDLHRLVEGLEHGQNVLMAVDYGPPEADELSLAARPVLEHVLARGATISVVSTRPDGTLAAAALVEDVADSDDQYELIGYRAGAATAVSQLLAASDNAPALLLILTSRPVPFRVWIEQAKAHYGEDLPVAAVASSALEPITAPYTDPSAGQLRAAIHGLRGGASYGVLRGTDDRAAQRLDALAAGHAVIVISIVIGAVFHAFAGTGEEGE
jgi:hypothetical protein